MHTHAVLILYSTHVSIAHFACYDFIAAQLLCCWLKRVCMCMHKLIIKVLSIFKTFPGNIITFFNLTVCQVF